MSSRNGTLALSIFSAIVAGKAIQCEKCGLARTSPEFQDALWRLMARMGLVTERIDEFLMAILEPCVAERERQLALIPQEEQEHYSIQVLCARIRHRTERDKLTIGELEDIFVRDVRGSGIPEETIRAFVRRLCNVVVRQDSDARRLLRQARKKASAFSFPC